MTEYKKLYNQIDKLNNKIKKLELSVEEKKKQNIRTNSSSLNKNNRNIYKSTLVSYRIYFPKESYSTKKYIGLKFDDNPNEYDSDTKSGNPNLVSFIKLIKSNVVINYTLQLELDCTPIDSIICSVAVGIRTFTDSKIRIIKGTKNLFDLATANKIDNRIIISNTLLYSAEDGEELCMIVDFDFVSGTNCVINGKKSLIKLLFV
jgi:hypothetical protein